MFTKYVQQHILKFNFLDEFVFILNVLYFYNQLNVIIMEMYQILLKRLILLTDEYLELCKEVKEIKSHLHYENDKKQTEKRFTQLKIMKIDNKK